MSLRVTGMFPKLASSSVGSPGASAALTSASCAAVSATRETECRPGPIADDRRVEAVRPVGVHHGGHGPAESEGSFVDAASDLDIDAHLGGTLHPSSVLVLEKGNGIADDRLETIKRAVEEQAAAASCAVM